MEDKKEELVNIGIIGSGFMGQIAHLQCYSTIQQCQIKAIAEIRPKLRQKISERYGIPKTYKHHTDLIKHCNELNGVVVVTRRNMTGPIVLDCLNSGLAVMTEKPMASTFEQSKLLVETAKKNNVVFKVGYNKRYDEGVIEVKNILENLSFTKELGDIIFARAHRFSGTGYCNMQPEVITDDKYPENIHEWSGSPDWLPEEWGIEYHRYLNTFSHNINLLRYFFECTPEVEYTSLRDSGSQIVILNFGKFKATLETKNYYDNNWDELTEIFFEHGCLIIETPPQLLKNVAAKIRLFNRKDGSIKTACVPKWSWSFQRQAESYIQDIVKKQIHYNYWHRFT